ncbi:MAG TPA: type II toxin-antitoxin system RelE/ParE family toxin [Conexibacter sp.]
MTTGPWRVDFGRRAERDMRRLDPPVRRRVWATLDRLAADDPSLGLLKLTGEETWRVRVGDWRVLFERDEAARQIIVVRVLPRGRAYDR